jgi:hypothetical protein
MAKTKRTNSVLQNITKEIKDQQGTHTNPGMTFGLAIIQLMRLLLYI